MPMKNFLISLFYDHWPDSLADVRAMQNVLVHLQNCSGSSIFLIMAGREFQSLIRYSDIKWWMNMGGWKLMLND